MGWEETHTTSERKREKEGGTFQFGDARKKIGTARQRRHSASVSVGRGEREKVALFFAREKRRTSLELDKNDILGTNAIRSKKTIGVGESTHWRRRKTTIMSRRKFHRKKRSPNKRKRMDKV